MQLEIEIPIQPPRVTLGKERALRDSLENHLRTVNQGYLQEIIAVTLRFNGADEKFHELHRPYNDFHSKRALEQLHELARFVAALEEKYAPGSLLHGRP